MLGDYPMDVLLLATDLQVSRDFYTQKIGLEIVREEEDAVWPELVVPDEVEAKPYS